MVRGVFPRRPHTRAVTPGHEGDRFPGFDVLGEVGTWDAATAGVVLARLGPPPPLRFFSPREEAIADGLLDHLLDQRDEPKVPALRLIDQRLSERMTDGWRYEDMPHDDEAWRLSLQALDDEAMDLFDAAFPRLSWDDQADIIQTVQDLQSEPWHGMPAARVWSLWTRYAAWAFYSHPWSWNEIGFGGPAYPRGYKNVGLDSRENWEVRDQYPERDPIQEIKGVEELRKRRAAETRRRRRTRSADGPGGSEGSDSAEGEQS